MIRNKIYIIILGASLWACSSHLVLHQVPSNVAISKEISGDSILQSFIKPYSDSLAKSMNQIIAYSDQNFIIERPCSNLMNWSADALLAHETRNVKLSQPVFCLLNTGGLRSGLNKGAITVGDMFKLMPFDNLVAWVQLPVTALPQIAYYLEQSGGEPIANARLENGKLNINGLNDTHEFVWLITSDYLANGGDKMQFFKLANSIQIKSSTLRSVFIEEAQRQGNLISNSEKRIKR
jgi:2',3'-cyclic-nucleotide 2'-phosphodiesterase (5'-nucleotidase family)